jgi:hypothetical protein
MEWQQRFTLAPDWAGADTATIVDADAATITRGDRFLPAGRQAFDDGRERVELAPERVLLAALAAPDLAAAPHAVQHRATRVRL